MANLTSIKNMNKQEQQLRAKIRRCEAKIEGLKHTIEEYEICIEECYEDIDVQRLLNKDEGET